MKFDRDSNFIREWPRRTTEFAPDGAHLGGIEFDGRVSNCKWGDDGSVLFIAANTAIYRVKTTTRGAGWQSILKSPCTHSATRRGGQYSTAMGGDYTLSVQPGTQPRSGGAEFQ